MTDYVIWGQLYYDGAWNVLPDLVRSNPGVEWERGVADDLDIKNGFCSFRLGDPEDLYRPSNAASPYYGQTGAYMKAAFATAGVVCFDGEAQAMTPGQSPDFQESAGIAVRGDRWVDVKIGGPLARVGKWRDPLGPALFTTITGLYGANLRGYWPMQDGKQATQLANFYQGGNAGTFTAVDLAAIDGPAGSTALLQTSDVSRLTFVYAPMSNTAGWQMVFAAILPNVDGTERVVWQWRTTLGHQWVWKVSNTSYRITVTDSEGTVLANLGTLHGTGAEPQQWITYRIKVTESGGTVTIEPAWYPETSGVFYGFSTSYAGSPGSPTSGGMAGNAATVDAGYGHHFVLTSGSDNLVALLFTEAFNGYVTETAADRFARLCESRGLPYLIRGDPDASVPMGPQPLATVLENFKQIRTSERGLIFDRGDVRGIVFCTNGYLYEQAADPVLDLTWPDDIAPPLLEDPATDQAFNLITLENYQGTTATRELKTGRLGTEDPPDGSGRIDKKIDVNIYDDSALESYANWWMRYFTQGATRFSTVVIDIDAQPGLLAACNDAEPGMFMRITGRTPDPLLLLILSKAQACTRKRMVFTFSVAPGEMFRAGVYGTTGKYQGNYTIANEAIDTTETAIDVKSDQTYSAGWSTTATPYDWLIGGERVTVTSITAPASSGGYWTQTATVTRSVNGVIKSHASGDTVKLADPVHWK